MANTNIAQSLCDTINEAMDYFNRPFASFFLLWDEVRISASIASINQSDDAEGLHEWFCDMEQAAELFTGHECYSLTPRQVVALIPVRVADHSES